MIQSFSLQRHVAHTMDQLYHLQDGTKLAVGVSGGADSLCLTLLLHPWAQSRHLQIEAVTVNHGLRPESAQEAQQVATWLSSYEISHTLLSCEPFEKYPVTQASAREARYRTLTSWCAQHNIKALVLGHHADDQLETFLMRLDHASGPYGLGCMAPRSLLCGLIMLRPLLNIRRQDLVQELTRRKQPWIEDPSNHQETFARTRYRAMVQMLEAQGLDMRHVLSSLQKIALHNIQWLRSSEDLLQKAVQEPFPQSYLIQRSLWCQAPEPTQLKALERLIQRLNPRPYPPKHFELKARRVLSAFQSPYSQTRLTLGGCLFELHVETIVVRPERALYS